jgi:hypothetical protein
MVKRIQKAITIRRTVALINNQKDIKRELINDNWKRRLLLLLLR